eukprot:8791524-Alexandrium_andersonii.AAC.1
MSASLVGSEMCIRDRFYPSVVAPSRSRDPRGRPHTGASAACELLGLKRRCLLYTSDAADDM